MHFFQHGDDQPVPTRVREVMVLPNVEQQIPSFFYEAIFNYERTHYESPRFILVGYQEMLTLKRLDAPNIVNTLAAEGHRMTVQGIEVIEVRRESFLEIVG
jgi:hypothetical protein